MSYSVLKAVADGLSNGKTLDNTAMRKHRYSKVELSDWHF